MHMPKIFYYSHHRNKFLPHTRKFVNNLFNLKAIFYALKIHTWGKNALVSSLSVLLFFNLSSASFFNFVDHPKPVSSFKKALNLFLWTLTIKMKAYTATAPLYEKFNPLGCSNFHFREKNLSLLQTIDHKFELQ